MWATLPMFSRALASEKTHVTPTTSHFQSLFFQECLSRGGNPGDISVEQLRRETTFPEHLLCARNCGRL